MKNVNNILCYKFSKFYRKYRSLSLVPSVYSNDYIVFDRMEIMMEEAIDSIRYLHVD